MCRTSSGKGQMSSRGSAVVFDLDQTLVESRSLEELRRARRWSQIYARIRELSAYDGVATLLERLRSHGVKVGIVTSSPSSYCSRLVDHCGFTVDAVVCYHDTKRHKPDSEPMLLALEKLGNIEPAAAVAVGDAPADIASARSAGVYSVAACWGCLDEKSLLQGRPDAIVRSLGELEGLLWTRFKLE